MKMLRGSLMIAVVLVASTSVFALTSPPWSGTFRGTLSTWSVSRIYTGYLAGHGPASNPNPADWLPAIGSLDFRKTYTNGELAQLDYFNPPNAASANETGWGVFRWDSVKSSTPTGTNNMTSGGQAIWDDTGKQIVGVFYGQQDKSVTFTKPVDPDAALDPLNWRQDITAFGAKYKMWYQDRGIFPEISLGGGSMAGANGADLNGDGTTMVPPLGPGNPALDTNGDFVEDGEEGWARRNLTTAPDGSAFEGIGYWTYENALASMGTEGAAITDPTKSELVLFGNSYNSPNDVQSGEIAITYDPMSITKGDLSTYIKLVSDPQYSWQPFPANQDSYFQRVFPYQMNPLQPHYQLPPGMEAQLYLHAVSTDNTMFGWSLSSDGATAVHGSVVPEPVTMISLALSGMGLVGYLRKRRS